MRKINPSSIKSKSTNRSINLSKVLNSDLFFESSTLIKLALNKNRILSKDFGIKRAKPKIDFGKKGINHLSPNSMKKEIKEEEEQNDNNLLKKKKIPFELADILDNNRTKFKKVYEAFHNMKEKNEIFISYWHYVQKSKERNRKKNLKISYEKRKNNDFLESLKKYDFSTRDKIELELQKKLTSNIFKSNPLMIKNNNDMLFYFLNMCKEKQINFREQNPTKYLTKIKEILDFMQTIIDYKDDKDLKVQNSKFMMKRKKKIDEENLKLREEQHKQNIIDNIESKKMIKQTKKSMKILTKNKSYFEDPNYFSNDYISSTFSNKKGKWKSYTPNKNIMMSKSTSNFFNNEKNFYSSKSTTLAFLQKKKKVLSDRLSSLKDDENNNKSSHLQKYYYFLDRTNNKNTKSNADISSLFRKTYNESFLKEKIFNDNQSDKKMINNIRIIQQNFKIKNNGNNDNNFPIIKKIPIGNNISPNADTLCQKQSNYSNIFSKMMENSNTNRKSINRNDSIRRNNSISVKNDTLRLSKRKSKLDESFLEEKNDNEIKNKNNSIELKNKKISVHDLYDIVKSGKDLDKNQLKKIQKFIYQKHNKQLKNKKDKDTVHFIKEVQLLSDGFDINKVCKSIETFPTKGIKQIKNFKKVNGELNKLDKRYVKEICEFKARNQRNDAEEMI